MSQVQKNTLKRRLNEFQDFSSYHKPGKIIVKYQSGKSKCEAFPSKNTCERPQVDETIQPQNDNTRSMTEKQLNEDALPKSAKIRRVLIARRASESRKRMFLKRFIQGTLIGEGAFGKVYAGFRRKDGLPVAIKYIPQSRAKHVQVGQYRVIPAEVYFQQQVYHPNIIELLEHHYFDGHHVLITERPINCVDLFDFLNTFHEVLIESEARLIFRQLLEAAAYLDEQGIVHNDIKSENVLLDVNDGGKVKLIDFGLAGSISDEPIRKFSGTPHFCPPEYHTHGQYNGRQATVWSLGCFLYDLLMGMTPYNSAQEAAMFPVYLSDHLSKDCFEFLGMMLRRNPAERASLHQLKEHSWLTNGP